MIGTIFHAIIYDPLYNGLVFLVGVIPSHDLGIAVILLTIVARIILYPLSRRAVQAQLDMKRIAPEVEKLKEKHKDDREQQSRAILELYKEHGIHPFANFGLVLVQIPILLGLYWVFSRGGLPKIDLTLLYPFVHPPAAVNMEFLGVLNVGMNHSIVLAVLAGVTQFLYTRLSMGPKQEHLAESTLSGDMAKSFDLQARYVLPAMIAVISFTVVAAAPLYWVTSNTFMILQEYIGGRRFSSPDPKKTPSSGEAKYPYNSQLLGAPFGRERFL